MVGRAVAALQRRIQRQVSKPHGHRVGRSGARKQQRRKSAHARQANTPALPLPSLCWLFIASAESPPGDCRALEAPEARGGAGAAQMPTNPPPCLSNHRGIIGGAGAAFWRLAWIIFGPGGPHEFPQLGRGTRGIRPGAHPDNVTGDLDGGENESPGKAPPAGHQEEGRVLLDTAPGAWLSSAALRPSCAG